MASQPRRTLFNFWENYLANVAYCKPRISIEYHSNTAIFQNHLSLGFQYPHICLCHSYFCTNNSASKVHLATTQQLSDINQYEDVFSCMFWHYMV
jgi:hypothetical protein